MSYKCVKLLHFAIKVVDLSARIRLERIPLGNVISSTLFKFNVLKHSFKNKCVFWDQQIMTITFKKTTVFNKLSDNIPSILW